MIIDHIENAKSYISLHPIFGEAFRYLAKGEFEGLAPGRNRVGSFFVIPVAQLGKGRDAARLERHEREVDIHFTVDGSDLIGWSPAGLLRQPDGEFDPEGDVQLFSDPPQVWAPVGPQEFAIFLPGDGHAPLGGDGHVRKAVLKIRIS
jgi:YhcH/YjgK/YiaL family protein